MKKLLHYYFFFIGVQLQANDYFQYKGTVKTSNAETLPGAVLIHTQRDQSIPPCRMKMVDLIC
jgi:hypothetical protein